MHEASIANAILDSVMAEAKNQNARQVEKVEIEIGDLTFLGIEQIEFWLKAGFENTLAHHCEIVFHRIQAEIECGQCHYQGPMTVEEDPAYHMTLPRFTCPECDSHETTVIRGKDAFIRNIHIIKE